MPVTKYDRKGYKTRSRQLLLTSNSAIIAEEAKVKQRIDYAALKGRRSTACFFSFCKVSAATFTEFFTHCPCRSPAGISVSSLSDGVFVLHVPSDDNKQKVNAKKPLKKHSEMSQI